MEATISRKDKKRAFIFNASRSIFSYVLVNAFLVVVNWVTSPYYWWVLWVIAGWGLGLFISLFSQYIAYKMNIYN